MQGSLHCPNVRDESIVYDWSTDPFEGEPLQGPERTQAYRQLIEALKLAPRREIPDERDTFLLRDERTTEQLRALGYIR
jgi:hypothetical protein